MNGKSVGVGTIHLENRTHGPGRQEQLETILHQTFKEIEDISNLRAISNAQLRRVIDRIEVDRNGNVEVFLKLFRELGLDETVRICNSRT